MHSDASEPVELEPVAIFTDVHPKIQVINDTFQPFQHQLPARYPNKSVILKPPKTEAVSLLKSLSQMSNITSLEDDILINNNETSGNTANVVALQEKIADARAELDMHKQHSAKRVKDLKHALVLAEDAKNISKTSLERSQQKLKDREQAWAATETRLASATEAARVDAAKVEEKLQLTKNENLKQLKKLERQKSEVDKDVKAKDITLGSITARFDDHLKVLESKVQATKEELNRTHAELSRAIDNVEERKHELNETKSEIDTVRADIAENKNKKETLAARVNDLEEELAGESAKNVELKDSVEHLEKQIAFKHESEEHFRSAEHSFRVIRAKVNETMVKLMKEREDALLVSQDLLKVNNKLRLLISKNMMDTAKTQRALVYFSKDTAPDEDETTTGPDEDETTTTTNEPNDEDSDFDSPKPQQSNDDENPQQSNSDRKPQQSNSDRKPQQSNSDQKPQQSNSDQKPQQSNSDQKPQQSNDDQKPQQSNGDQNPQQSNGGTQLDSSPGTSRFAHVNRHGDSTSETSHLRNLFYGSIPTASRN